MDKISGGMNIAIKIPRSHFEKTLAFYRDTLGLALKKEEGYATESYSAVFGNNTLWLDCVDGMGKADIWLEALTTNLNESLQKISVSDGFVRNEIEQLPSDMKARWICDPCGNTILLREK
jgi:catechol 2,3-dioxygenase-like lactoylglutathione lyase family enzyme